MAPKTQQEVMDAITTSISQDMTLVSTHEEQREELDMAEATYDTEAEEELVGQAAGSEHYSALANRLFSEVEDAAQESKAPSTLAGYKGQIKKFKAYVHGLRVPRLMDLLDHPGKDTPKLIAAWIRSSCGPDAVQRSEASRRKRGGAKKGTANSWSQAEKM
ncbi:hypothetical protein Egran_00018, partial [Elaphomyces granulatus]